MKHTIHSKCSPSEKHTPSLTEEHAVLSIRGGHLRQGPFPTPPASQTAAPTHAPFTEHLVHPGPFASDVQISQHSGHFQAKVLSSLCPMPSTLCPPQVDSSLESIFYRLCTMSNSIKCSHCITDYLYSHLGIP